MVRIFLLELFGTYNVYECHASNQKLHYTRREKGGSPSGASFVQEYKVVLTGSVRKTFFHVIWHSGRGHRWPTKLTLFLLYFWRKCRILCFDFWSSSGDFRLPNYSVALNETVQMRDSTRDICFRRAKEKKLKRSQSFLMGHICRISY